MNGDEPEGFKFDKSVIRMVFDTVLALIVATVGYTVNGIHNELRDIKSRDDAHDAALALIREKLPLEYVRLDIYLRDRQEMRDILNRIDTNVREHRERVAEQDRKNREAH